MPVPAVLAVLLATATESGSHALAAVDARKTSGFVGKSIVETWPRLPGAHSLPGRNARTVQLTYSSRGLYTADENKWSMPFL